MATQLTRAQAAPETTWNLSDIYRTHGAWEAAVDRIDVQINEATAYRDRLHEGGAVLLAFLLARDRLFQRFERVVAYAQLHWSSDATSPTSQEMAARADAIAARLGAALAFFETELLALPSGTVEGYLEETPALAPYRTQLHDVLRKRDHMLSAETEGILAELGETLHAPGHIHGQVTATLECPPVRDASGREIRIDIASFTFGLATSPDRDLRRQAYESLTSASNTHKAGLAGTLAASMQRDVVTARLRGYASTAEMFLESQQVPVSVYHTVIDTMHDEVSPHVRRLLDLRRRVLHLDRLQMYDVVAPLDPSRDPRLGFEEVHGLLRGALAPLGSAYGQMLDTAFRDRWIDRANNVGRAAVPFCFGVYGVHPYILTVWDDRMANAFILAHELGHACHDDLANRAQIVSNAAGLVSLDRIQLFIEVPSRVHELLLALHLLDTAPDAGLRRWAILHLLDSLLSSMRTTMLGAHLERRLHRIAERGQPITLATIMHEQGEVLERFFGPALEVNDAARLYWVQWPHFYAGTYNFTYPAGIACAYGIVEAIRSEGNGAASRYIEVLRAGSSLPPLELARQAGVDLTTAEPMKRFAAFFGEMVDELEGTSGP